MTVKTQTPTKSATLRQYTRYLQISEVTVDYPLWLIITEAMLYRYSESDLKGLYSGQGSIMRSVSRRVRDNFTVTEIHGINQRVDDCKDIPLQVVSRDMVSEITDYVTDLLAS